MKTVFTNGCFDIIHAGHIDMLWKARSLGDYLIVALNSDESVKKLKGENRPINTLDNRMSVVRALRMVDKVMAFNDENIVRLLYEIQPYVWVKGGDYTLISLNHEEVEASKAVGCKIEIVSVVVPISTTSIINKIL